MDLISNVITSGVVCFLGYCVLYKCCAILCENKKTDLEGLIEEYKVNGITRIILETFKLFAEKMYFIVIKYNFIEVFFKRFFFQNADKPIMKDDKIKDRILLFEYLIKCLDKKDDSITDTFKHTVETIWQDKWSFFAHSGYVEKLLAKIGDLCYENNLPIITFLITYRDGTLSNNSFQERWKTNENGWGKAGLKKDDKNDCEEFKKYLKKILSCKKKYKELFQKWKNSLNYNDKNETNKTTIIK